MAWYAYLAYFAAGALLANGVPHFVNGISGKRFQSPFAWPPGVGESPPLVNVIWGLANFAGGFALIFGVGYFRFGMNRAAIMVVWAPWPFRCCCPCILAACERADHVEAVSESLFNPLAPTPPEADLRSWGKEERKLGDTPHPEASLRPSPRHPPEADCPSAHPGLIQREVWPR